MKKSEECVLKLDIWSEREINMIHTLVPEGVFATPCEDKMSYLAQNNGDFKCSAEMHLHSYTCLYKVVANVIPQRSVTTLYLWHACCKSCVLEIQEVKSFLKRCRGVGTMHKHGVHFSHFNPSHSYCYHRRKKITNYVKQIWPSGFSAPKFLNCPEANKKLLQIVDKLAKGEEFSMPRLGLWAIGITQIIHKHMDEQWRNESEGLEATGKLNYSLCSSESDTASNTWRESTTDREENKFEDYFNTGKPCLY